MIAPLVLPHSSVPSDHYRRGLVLLVRGRLYAFDTRCALRGRLPNLSMLAPVKSPNARGFSALGETGYALGRGACAEDLGLMDWATFVLEEGLGETDSSVLALLADLSQCKRTRLEERHF